MGIWQSTQSEIENYGKFVKKNIYKYSQINTYLAINSISFKVDVDTLEFFIDDKKNIHFKADDEFCTLIDYGKSTVFKTYEEFEEYFDKFILNNIK